MINLWLTLGCYTHFSWVFWALLQQYENSPPYHSNLSFATLWTRRPTLLRASAYRTSSEASSRRRCSHASRFLCLESLFALRSATVGLESTDSEHWRTQCSLQIKRAVYVMNNRPSMYLHSQVGDWASAIGNATSLNSTVTEHWRIRWWLQLKRAVYVMIKQTFNLSSFSGGWLGHCDWQRHIPKLYGH